MAPDGEHKEKTMSTKNMRSRISSKAVQTIRPEGLYRWDEFADRIPFSRETWRQRILKGQAPAATITSRACTAWRGSDILAWLKEPDAYLKETNINAQKTSPTHRQKV